MELICCDSGPALPAVGKQHASIPEWIAVCSKVGESLAFYPIIICLLCLAKFETPLRCGNSHYSAKQVVGKDLTLLILLDAVKIVAGHRCGKYEEEQNCHRATPGTACSPQSAPDICSSLQNSCSSNLSCLINVGRFAKWV